VNDSRSLSPAARWLLYYAIIALAAGLTVGRILKVHADHGRTPFLSANDRSRWEAIRALVDYGTFEIDEVERDRDWRTIDKVRHKGPDGRWHYYSSKPPLLATILAGEYYLIRLATGQTLAERPFFVARLMLLLTNVPLVIALLLMLGRVADELGGNDASRLFVMIAAAAGTYLTTFAVTLNNHLPAAVCTMAAVYLALPLWRDDRHSAWRYAAAGFFAAFAVTNELPALSLFALLGAGLLWKSPVRTLLCYTPAAAVVAAAFFGTNYLAHHSLRPPYAHRGDGPLIGTVSPSVERVLDDRRIPPVIREALEEYGYQLSPQAAVQVRPPDRWVIDDEPGGEKFSIIRRDDVLEIREWDQWYDYPGSYWLARQGIDLGERSRLLYLFHMLLGHHGVFSLTPIWLISAGGIAMMWAQPQRRMRGFAVLTVVLFIVCVAFYVARPLPDRNYGGVSCCFRWLLWQVPLWLIALLPAADFMLRHRRWQWIAILLLGISIASATFSSDNPWTHPWLYQYWQWLGWVW